MMQNNKDLLHKPLKTKQSLVFSSVEKKLEMHPVVLFVDHFNYFYFIKARGAYNVNNTLKPQFKSEILIKQSNKGLFNKDSYLDVSRIFKIKGDLFKKYVQVNQTYTHTSHLKKDEIKKLYTEMLNLMNQKPMEIAYFDLYYVKNHGLRSKCKYAHPNIIQQDLGTLYNEDISKYQGLYDEITKKRNHLKSTINEINDLKLLIKKQLVDLNQSKPKNHQYYLEEDLEDEEW